VAVDVARKGEAAIHWQACDQLKLKLQGALVLDVSDEADRDFFSRLQPGAEVKLRVTATVIGSGIEWVRESDGARKAIVATHRLAADLIEPV
jgi:hypothetical protein